MVIYIHKSIGQVLSSRGLSEEETVFFSRLAYLHRDGLGYLCGDFDSLSHLSQTLPGFERGIYRALGEHYTESGMVINAVRKVLVPTFQKDPATLPVVLQRPGKALFVPVPDALEWTLWEKCCLLGENLNDCVFSSMWRPIIGAGII